MVPVGAIVAVVILALRAINSSQSNGGEVRNAAPRQTSRGTSTAVSDPGFAGTLLLQLLLYSAWLPGLGFGIFERSWVGFVIFAVAHLLLFPARVSRKLFVPLGLARLAYATAWLSRVTWRRDKPGGPALMAAWAVARQRKPSALTIAWIEQKLDDATGALQASGLAARGLLEAAKGHHETARRWLESVALMDPRIATRLVRRIACEWLMTDAAARGEWKQVRALAEDERWPGSATRRLLGAVAARLMGQHLPTNAGLWTWWLLAPHRLSTWSFVREATRYRVKAEKPEGLPTPPHPLDGLAHATFLTLALRQQEKPLALSLVKVARAWEDVFAPEARSKLFERSVLIGGGDPDAAVEEVRGLVEAALGPLFANPSGRLPNEVPSLVSSALAAKRDALYAELEQRVDQLDQRKQEKRELPALEEWREVLSVMELYRQACALGGESERGLAHSIVKDKLLNFGVWLYNDRTERPLANAIFRELLVEAQALGDAEAIRLNTKNSKCDL